MLMNSLTADICAVMGMLALLAFLLRSTLRINRNRKVRIRGRKVTARLLSWK